MLGIVILNYQTWEISLRCMKSIEDTKNTLDIKIYLVDNASKKPMPEDIKQYIKAHETEVCFIQSEVNRGYAAGNNIGIKRALEDGCINIVITNNDIIFCENSLQNFVKVLRKHPEVGIVGPKVIDMAGNIQKSHCAMKTGMKEIFQIYTVAKVVCQKKWKEYFCLNEDPEQSMFPYHVSGCCFAISAKCAKDITPLDEGTMLYYEEPIIGIRMAKVGYKTLYVPEVVIIHQHGATTDSVQPFMYQCICESEMYYCSKYLHAKKWQLWMLYQYRRILFWIRSRKNDEMIAYWEKFNKETKIKFRQCCK